MRACSQVQAHAEMEVLLHNALLLASAPRIADCTARPCRVDLCSSSRIGVEILMCPPGRNDLLNAMTSRLASAAFSAIATIGLCLAAMGCGSDGTAAAKRINNEIAKMPGVAGNSHSYHHGGAHNNYFSVTVTMRDNSTDEDAKRVIHHFTAAVRAVNFRNHSVNLTFNRGDSEFSFHDAELDDDALDRQYGIWKKLISGGYADSVAASVGRSGRTHHTMMRLDLPEGAVVGDIERVYARLAANFPDDSNIVWNLHVSVKNNTGNLNWGFQPSSGFPSPAELGLWRSVIDGAVYADVTMHRQPGRYANSISVYATGYQSAVALAETHLPVVAKLGGKTDYEIHYPGDARPEDREKTETLQIKVGGCQRAASQPRDPAELRLASRYEKC